MKRSIHSKLKEWKGKKGRKPLILKGCRQIGKTHTLLEFAKAEFSNYHYINFEEQRELVSAFEANLTPNELIHKISKLINRVINIQEDLLILDEIQECPRALTSLKYFCENMPELALATAGSLLGVRLNEVSYPVGKTNEIDMYPMSFLEFLEALEETMLLEMIDDLSWESLILEPLHKRLWELLKIYFVTGGLPEVVKAYIDNQDLQVKAFEIVRQEQRRLIQNYTADMAKHSGKENSVHLEMLWSNIPLQLSQDIDGSSSKFKIKGVIPEKNKFSRISSTIDWLEAAGLIIRIPIIQKVGIPLKAYTKPNWFKLFIFDVGILGALAGIDPRSILSYDYGTYKGFFAENFVAQEFLYADPSYKEPYAWRENRAELEFVKDINGEIYPIEVKSGNVVKSKSLSIFAERYSTPYKTILSAQNLQINKELKLHKYPLYLASKFPLSSSKDF